MPHVAVATSIPSVTTLLRLLVWKSGIVVSYQAGSRVIPGIRHLDLPIRACGMLTRLALFWGCQSDSSEMSLAFGLL
jgi:hypothetical protein